MTQHMKPSQSMHPWSLDRNQQKSLGQCFRSSCATQAANAGASTPALKAHFGCSTESIVKFIDALDDGCNLLLQLRPKPKSKKL